jgi:hypothetical protein
MRNKFLRIPFATDGDKTAFSDATDLTGAVSYTQGWGPDYQRDQTTDPLAKDIDRATVNYLLNVVTTNLQQYQTEGIPEWIAASDNNGSSYAYDAGITVRYRASTSDPFTQWTSLVSGNTATPGTDLTTWQPVIVFEATDTEATTGTASDKIITPRRWLSAFLAKLVTPTSDPTYASASSVLAAVPSWIRGVVPNIITSIFTGNQSLVTNGGYLKLPGGLIIQWGFTGSLAGGSTAVITFPTAFPNNTFGVFFSPKTSGMSPYVQVLNKPNFTWGNSPGATTGDSYWFAIGN